ncbi:MAG: glycerol-3-phosphate dehydrogenase [Elainellaceae cyanobacterium]
MLNHNNQALQDQTYDLIVVGGGINGAGVARDAAMRGLKTILIEKGDFCGGTTSWSTRLIHGGLRYLEYFEVALVRESLREREVLLRTAPHLVKPLLLTIPIYRDRSRPYWKIQAGMVLYDVLSFDKTLPMHRMLSRQKFAQLFRHLDPEDLSGAAQYYDAQVEYAERLALETIRAAEEAGATVLNYTTVTDLVRQGDRVAAVTCRDTLSGDEFQIRGTEKPVIINTAGPWVDEVLARGSRDGEAAPIGKTKKIGGTKGSHIIVNRFPGAPKESALYVEAKSDGRPFFIVPFLNNQVLIGTTDLKYTGSLDNIKADNDEIDYLITETNNIIPSAQLQREDIIFTFSGVRPLPYAEGKKAGSITRSHILYDHTKEGANNLVSLIGGKITTYRQVGEEMVNLVFQKRGTTAPSCSTDHEKLPGASLPHDALRRQTMQEYQSRVPMASLEHLFDVYGAKAVEILKLTDEYPDLAEAIAPGLPDIKAQIVYSVQAEYARTLVDILRRRTSLCMQGNYGLDLLPSVTQVLERYCGWNSDESDRQMRYYRDYMALNCIPDFAIAESLPAGISQNKEPELSLRR